MHLLTVEFAPIITMSLSPWYDHVKSFGPSYTIHEWAHQERWIRLMDNYMLPLLSWAYYPCAQIMNCLLGVEYIVLESGCDLCAMQAQDYWHCKFRTFYLLL